MSALAAYLHHNGATVTGSDSRKSLFSEHLEQLGIPVYYDHDASHVDIAQTVVYTPAVGIYNPEVAYARLNDRELLTRGQLLARIANGKKTIAVAGSHGKTSTTSFIAWLMFQAGIALNALIGGIMRNFDLNYLVGDSEWLVVEADESDGSMALLEPEILVLLNIDDDHMDHYGSREKMIDAYRYLAQHTRARVLLNFSDPLSPHIADASNAEVSYFNHPRGYRVDESSVSFINGMMQFDLFNGDTGAHKMLYGVGQSFFTDNFLAAFEVVTKAGMTISDITQGAGAFQGVRRRGEVWSTGDNVCIIEDYAHHPTEIKMMLNQLKRWGNRRIVCVFQPHRYTRSRQIADALAESFSQADILILTEIYSADEKPIDGINGSYVFHKVQECRQNHCHYIPDLNNILNFLEEIVQPGDIVAFTGAGSVGSLALQYKNICEQVHL